MAQARACTGKPYGKYAFSVINCIRTSLINLQSLPVHPVVCQSLWRDLIYIQKKQSEQFHCACRIKPPARFRPKTGPKRTPGPENVGTARISGYSHYKYRSCTSCRRSSALCMGNSSCLTTESGMLGISRTLKNENSDGSPEELQGGMKNSTLLFIGILARNVYTSLLAVFDCKNGCLLSYRLFTCAAR
jgi:hypothetical protein